MPRNQSIPQKWRIVWISNLILDAHLHKTSRIEMLRALAKRGHEVSLVASYSSKKSLGNLAYIQLVLIPMRYVPFVSAAAYALLILLYMPFLFFRLKPDFVIVEPNATILSLMPMVLFPKFKRLKVVLDIRSTPVGISGIAGSFKVTFFKIALQTAKKLFQGITIITELMKKHVCENYNVNPRLVGVWTSGVSTIFFNPENYDRDEMRKKFDLRNRFVVFHHGVFSEGRGIIETIKAVGMLRSRYPDLVLFLLGRAVGSFEPENTIRKLGVQNSVVVHDSVSYAEVPKYISICDVGIVPLPSLPDWRYQCPLNLLEYLAMKKVVIATDIPANREVLRESKCGIYASSADPKEIAEAIIYVYNHRKMLRKWGAHGRMIVEERYSWDKLAGDLENYLLKL